MEGCTKRRFSSAKQAKRAHRRAGFRLRAYQCQHCHAWHVSNSEKRQHSEYRRGR